MSSSEQQAIETGRRAVRIHLIQPLQAAGMMRRQGETLAEEAAFIERLVGKLSHMTTDNLRQLKPYVQEAAGGTHKNRWPGEIGIVNMAYSIQPPPDHSDEILRSWLHSRAGVRAREEGVLMATRLFIKRFRRPPVDRPGNRYYADKLRENQREIERDIERLRRVVSSSEARATEVEQLRTYDDRLAQLEAIVEAGIEHRKRLAENSAA